MNKIDFAAVLITPTLPQTGPRAQPTFGTLVAFCYITIENINKY
jgi:hypothetical protein